MPEEYRHHESPTKQAHVTNQAVPRESWIVVGSGTMSPDPNGRPSMENGSIRLVNHPSHVVHPAPEEYRPPPPLIDPTSRTSSAASIPHGAGPPTVLALGNPNYKVGIESAQNIGHVNKDRPHDAASIHAPSTPREAIGHLDPTQLQAKEDRESAVLRKRNRGSGMLGSMFGTTHEPRASMEDVESIHSTQAPEKERHGFRSFFGTSREKEREKEKERERERERDQARHRGIDNDRTQWEMSRLIGYTTSTNVEDWSVVMEICDKINQHDSEAREASKALRKDIQFGRPAVQLSAARLWAILMRNCMQYFVAHTTSRKFLGRIEEVALNPTTSPVVRDRLVEVIGTSVYLLRDSKNLKPYQATWKKLRLQLKLPHPNEGLEIPADDPILNPTPHRPPSSLRHLNEPTHPEVAPNVAVVTQGLTRPDIEPTPTMERRNTGDTGREHRRGRTHQVDSTYGLISPEEDMRRLFEECEIARDNCRILADSLVYATPDSITSNNVIKEFRAKCMKSQEIIGAQIEWATAAADRARAEQHALKGPNEVAPTAEEQLLQAILTAHGDLNDVFKTYDDLERIAISEREEAEVRARSKVELRLDRTKHQITEGGEVYMIPPDEHGPSRSQTHTPTPASTPAPPAGHPRRPLPQPAPVNSLAPPPPAPHGPRPISRNRTPSPNLGSEARDLSTDESSQESELPPTLPSEKAMGKRRAEPPPEEEKEWPDHNSLLHPDSDDGDDDDGNPKEPEVFLYDAALERKKQKAVAGK